jgi:D-proline reductase (dithiol) PrdB
VADPPGKDTPRQVDPWRFAGSFLKKVLSALIPEQPSHGEIPWAPVTKPLARSKVALVSTAGLSMREDPPFDMELERQNPLRGDPSWRRLRADATAETIAANHLVALPLDRLRELVSAGEVGAMAETHYSIMGYQGNDTSTLEAESAPQIAAAMVREEVDLALLAPV